VQELRKFYAQKGVGSSEAFQINFEEQLPLADYFRLIDEHFEHRLLLNKMQEDLDGRAKQFRVVQKRLLTRFKDKNPSPLQHLDTLLNHTLQELMFLAEQTRDCKTELDILLSRVSAGTQALLLLMELKFRMGPPDMKVLRLAFNPRHNEACAQGWEEATDTSLLCLLKTTLSKDPKEGIHLPPPAAIASQISIQHDTSKLKKHISNICEKLVKGHRPTGKTSTA